MQSLLRVAVIVTVAALLAPVTIGFGEEIKGRYRIYLVDREAKFIEGEVKELPDGSYEVRTKQGAIITIKKNQVKAMVPLEEAPKPPAEEPAPEAPVAPKPADAPTTARRAITDQEIETLLAGITAEIQLSYKETTFDKLMQELPANEKAVEEMVRKAGGPEKAKVLRTPHFVMVYTSTKESADKLGARLESVWRWNAKFMDDLKLVPRQPEYKLELFYFAQHQEFEAYSLNEGHAMPTGVLGYWAPGINRSHFFDLWNWPTFDNAKKMLEDKRVPARQKQVTRNKINAWVEFKNQEVIQHEAGHHIHHTTGVFRMQGPPTPTWLVEGTTMQFEVAPAASGQGGSGLGELNDNRLNEFRHIFVRKMTPAEFKEWVLNDQLWNQGVYDYPRGWAVVHYLWKRHRDGLGEYIRRIYAEESGDTITTTSREKDFEDCFGRVDEAWMKDFYKFFDSLHVRKSRLPPELRP